MENQVAELTEFNTACDEFVSGKYILADIKIASILKIIAKDEKIANIISSCLEGYDFETSFANSVIENEEGLSVVVPKDEKSIIAFAYSLLYRFGNKTVDIYTFVTKYFSNEDESVNHEFYNFASLVIVPFKMALNSIYSKRHIIVAGSDYQTNYYNKIKTSIHLIMDNINGYKLKMNEKDEFTMLLNSLYIAAEKNDKKLVYSLMVAIDYFSRYNRKTRSAYLMLQECFN